MTKMVATVAALQLVETGPPRPRRAHRHLLPRVRRRPGARRLRRRHPAPARPGEPGHGQAARHPHHRAGLLVLRRGPRQVGGRHQHPERPLRRRTWSSRRRCSPTPAPPTSTGSTPTGWARSSRPRAASALDVAIKDGITGPLGMDETAFQIAEAWKDGGLDPRAGEGRRRLGGQRHRAEPEPGVLRGRARAVLHAQRLHQVRAGAPARRRAGRRPDPASDTVDAAFTNQIGELDFPPAHPDGRPVGHPRVQRRAGLEVGLRAAAQHRGPARACGARAAARGPGCATRTSGWTAPPASARRSTRNFLPFVTPEAFALYNDYERALYAAL